MVHEYSYKTYEYISKLANYILQILNQTFQRVDQSATWLTASWFVGELPCYRIGQLVEKLTH